MDLYQHFLIDLNRLGCLPHLAGQRVVVAVSGGADSLCLLHLLRRATADLALELVVATLDHGLRGADGAADVAYVAELARGWGLPVETGQVDLPALAREHGLSGEEAARRARYSFLAGIARRHSAHAIATGHHADDQAETVLLHLIRGSGLGGLRGMQPVTPLTARHLLPGDTPPPDIPIVRPLLAQPRTAIDTYCAEHGLAARQDITNAQPIYARNRIRHELLPLLEQLNPAIRASLVRASLSLQDDYTKLEMLTNEALTTVVREQHRERLTLDLAGFRTLDASLQRRVLRLALRSLAPDTDEPGFEALDAALALARRGTPGQQATLPAAIALTVGYGTLSIARPGASSTPPPGPWLPPGDAVDVTIPGDFPLGSSGWHLISRWLTPEEDPAAFYRRPLTAVLSLPQGAHLQLRTRQPGDRFAPLGMGGRIQKLKETLINARIPATDRATLPLLTVNAAIAWLVTADHARIAEPFAVRLGDAHRALFVCEYGTPPRPPTV